MKDVNTPSTAGSSLIQRGIDIGDRRGRKSPMSMFNKLDLDLPRSTQPTTQPLLNRPNSGLPSSIETSRSEEAGPAQMPDLLLLWNKEGYHNPNEMVSSQLILT